MSPRRAAVRQRLSRRAGVLALVCFLFLGVMGTALATVLSEQLERQRAAALPGHGPSQRWGDVDGGGNADGPVNKADPVSLQSQYPVIKGQAESAAPANQVRVTDGGPRAVRGFDASTSTELADRRTEHARTFANQDGTETTELSQEPLNHQRSDGTWAPIDPTAVRVGDEGWRNTADSVDVRLAAAADTAPLVRFALDDDHQFGFSLRGAAKVAGRAQGTEVSYPSVLPQVDLRFDLRAGAVKETIVLASPDTPRTFDFPLHLKGLEAKVVDGRIVLTDRDGKQRAVVPTGYMEDSSAGAAGPAYSPGVRYELVGQGAQQSLRVGLDDAWLKDPARQYPVLVDPTVTSVESPASMYVQRQSSGGNFSNAGGQELRAGTVVGGGSTINTASYLSFPGIENTLRNNKVFGASLALTNFHSFSCNARPISVHPVTVPWEANNGHSYPGPAFGEELSSSSFAYGYIASGASRSNCPQSTAAVDLGGAGRDLVQRWVNGTQANYGLTVRASETDQYSWKKFYGHGTANKPRLFVTHTPYDAAYRIDRPVPEPPLLKGGQPGKVGITVTNLGATTWNPSEYVLSYRQFSSAGAPMVQVNDAARLPREIARGESVSLEAAIQPPREWGEYTFEFSMHRKGHAYFVDEQIPPAVIVLTFQNVPPVLQEQYPPNGYSSPTLHPTLWAKGVDIDNGGAGLQYRFVVCDKANSTSCVDSGYSTSPAWTAPAGALRWSKTYLWNAYVKDSGGAESSPVQGSTLFTAVPQPEITSHLGNAPYGGSAGDVDAQVGNYRTSAVDASVGNTGPTLTVARTYNSLDPRRDLAFGAGWTNQYDMRVVEDQDGSGNVVITYPDGQQVRFGHNGGGTYAPPPGRYATLFRNADNGWTLVDKDFTGYYFRADGRLGRITDNAQRAVELAYDTGGKLATVRSPLTGRALAFSWVGSHVDSVRTDQVDGVALTWRYTYEGDKLTKVCDPSGNCTRYDYSTGSHYRSAVLDAKPESYWPLGESTGDRAASQIGVNLTKDFGTYVDVARGKPGIAAGSPDAAAGFNGVKSRVTLPENAIRKNRDVSIELWFKTTKAGPLIAFQNKAFDQNPTAAVPALYVGTDGKLRGQFWTDRNPPTSPITTAGAVNDGQWHHVVLSAAVASQTMFLDGVKVGEFAGVIDNLNLPHGQIGAGFASGPSDWSGWTTTSKWFFEGEIDEVAIYAHPLGLNQVRAHHAARATSDQLAGISLPSGRKSAQLRFDTVNDRVSEYVDHNGGTWKFGTPVVTGNETNVVRTVRVTDPANRNHFYDFDPIRGRILRQLSPLGIETRTEDRPPGTTTPPPTSSTCAPQPGGSFCDVPIGGDGGFVDIEFQGVRSFSYDESGFQTTITDETGRQILLVHDERGNVTSRKTCRAISNCQTAYYAYHRNPADDTDPRNDKLVDYRDSRSANATDNRFRTRYTYDTRGSLITQTTADSAVVTHTYTDGNTPAYEGGNEPKGLVKVSKDPRGAETRYSYYRNGDLAEVRSPSGLTKGFRYDSLGRRTSSKEVSAQYPQGLTTTYQYDERSRLVRTVEPALVNAVTGTTHIRRTAAEYDADGRQIRVEMTDLTGGDQARVATTAYDRHGRPERITDAEGGETSYGYDVFGNRTWQVNANGVRHEFAYTARNALSEVRLRGWNGDPDGAPALPHGYLVLKSFAYDGAGRLVRTTDAMQRTEMRGYYNDDLLKSRKLLGTTAGSGQRPKIDLESNVYDAAGNLTEQRFAGGLVSTYEYDAVGRTIATTNDPTGLKRRTAFGYDLNGNVTQVTRTGNESNTGSLDSGDAEVVDYVYDAAGRRTRQEVQLGSTKLVTSWQYDQRGLPTTITSPLGNVAGADPAAFTTDMAYDAWGQVVSVTAPPVSVESGGGEPVVARPVVKTGYNNFGQVTERQDANGQVRRTEMDKLGRTVRSFSPSYTSPGQEQSVVGNTSTNYDRLGNVLASTDARGAITRFRYDQLNRLIERQEPDPTRPTEAGSSWHFTYTRNGELLSTVDPSGARTESTYDDFGRRVTDSVLERFPASTMTSDYEYDDAGRLTKVIPPSRGASTFAYDGVGQMIRSSDAAGVATNFGYDLAGRMVKTTDALSRATRSGYDTAGRLVSARMLAPSGALLSKSVYTYDAADNLTSVTDPMGQKSTFAYDALNRLTQQVEPVADTETITTGFGYDATGNRTAFTDGRGNKTVSTFNSFGLPESTVEPVTAAHPDAADRTWTTAYNSAGDAVRLLAPGGVVRDRTFDGLGRLTKETGSGAETATAERVLEYDVLGRLAGSQGVDGKDTFTYNDRGLLLTAAGQGGNATREYDADGRMTIRADASGTSRTTYDKGRTATVQDGVTGLTQTIGYDDAGQVSKIDLGSGRERAFTYDDSGRLATDTVGTAVSTSYGYDKNGRLTNKTASGAANTYGYDHAGRITSWTSPNGTSAYGWDAAGNRTHVDDKVSTYDERNRLRTEGEQVYTYSARGTLTSRTGGDTSVFDAFDRLVRQGTQNYGYDSLDRVGKRNGQAFVYGGTSNELVSDGQATYSRGPGDGLLAVGQGAEKRLAVSDRHGDLVGTLDPDGPMTGLADSAAYDPFGRVVSTTGTKRAIGFQGDWTDPSTGQVNMTARWYDPGSGGFVSRDDYSLPGTPSGLANRYGYGVGSPLNYADPSGHIPAWCMGGPGACNPGGGSWFGDFLCVINPARCQPEPPPPGETPPPRKVNGGSGDQEGRGSGKTVRGGSGHRSPTDNAREQARQFGRSNPLPVPEALKQPLFGNGRTPPVSSSPQLPSHLAGDLANPVEDVNKSYSNLYANLLAQNGSVIQEASDAFKSPVILTSATPPGCRSLTGNTYECPGRAPERYSEGLNREETHDLLALGGMLPGWAGPLFDLQDAGKYLSEGDWDNGLMSLGFAIPFLGDAARAGKEGIELFRGMREGSNGTPKVGESARDLGVRTDPSLPKPDIRVDENGMVHPDTGGMSVAPLDPRNLPNHRKPSEFGGEGRDPVWCTTTCDLPDGLKYVQDKPSHGTIQPSRSMPYEEYKRLLEGTQGSWNKVSPTPMPGFPQGGSVGPV